MGHPEKLLRPFLLLFVTAMLIVLVHCSAQISGTEVTNERSIVYLPGGKEPAAYAQVSVVPTDHIPEASVENEKILEVITDGQGSYSVTGLQEGYYNILARKDQYAFFEDSVYLAESEVARKDTLDIAGAITGRVVLQPNHDPRSVLVQVIGTSVLYERVDSRGYFTLSGLAQGEYQALFVTTLDNYTPTPEKLRIRSGVSDTLTEPIEMIYTGIPVVENIKAVYDPVSKLVRVSWDSVQYSQFDSYLVYRENMGEQNQNLDTIARISGTEFCDSLKDTEITDSLHLRYRVAVSSTSLKRGEMYAFSDVKFLVSDQPITLFSSENRRFEVNRPCTLKIEHDASFGENEKYFWSFGEDSAFFQSSGPETTIVVNAPGDTVIDDFPVQAKVVTASGFEFTDSLKLQSRLVWERVSRIFSSGIVGFRSVATESQIFVFCQSESASGNSRWSVWSSPNCRSWECVTDSLPFDLTCDPLEFDGKLWALQRDESKSHAVIWQSENGSVWNSSDVQEIPNGDFSSDYDVWSVIGDRIVLLNYYPLCLQRGTCRNEIPGHCWESQNGTVWQKTDIPASVFPDRLDNPNRNFAACTFSGKLVVAGAWRSLYLTYPVSAAYSVRVWNDFQSYPETILFPSPLYQNDISYYNPRIAEYNGRLYLSAQINMENSVSPDANTSYLWVLREDNSWFMCSDVFPAISSSEMKGDYHALVVFKNDLCSISNSGVWKIVK